MFISTHPPLQYATLSYMSLYDALYLVGYKDLEFLTQFATRLQYGLALRDAYDETKNESIYVDGGYLWRKMTARQFVGMTLGLGH